MLQKEQRKQALKLARLTINAVIGVYAFCVFLIIQQTWYPDLFERTMSDDMHAAITVEDTLVMAFGIDSADIENGIHLPTGLIVDRGIQEVMTTCAACHSLDLVKQNRATREGWKDLIVWMQETQKLWDLGESEAVILDYLSKNYAPTNTGRRKNLEVAEWYDL